MQIIILTLLLYSELEMINAESCLPLPSQFHLQPLEARPVQA